MSEDKLFLELITIDKIVVSEEVDGVYLPGSDGDLEILPMHAELIGLLRSGEMRYSKGKNTEYVALDGGFLEVNQGKVTVLADGAELGRNINLEEAIRRRKLAEEELEKARIADSAMFATIEAKLARELIRINVAGHYK